MLGKKSAGSQGGYVLRLTAMRVLLLHFAYGRLLLGRWRRESKDPAAANRNVTGHTLSAILGVTQGGEVLPTFKEDFVFPSAQLPVGGGFGGHFNAEINPGANVRLTPAFLLRLLSSVQ